MWKLVWYGKPWEFVLLLEYTMLYQYGMVMFIFWICYVSECSIADSMIKPQLPNAYVHATIEPHSVEWMNEYVDVLLF